MILTSSSNERIKHAKRVREGREPQLIFIEGERLVEEAAAVASLKWVVCFHSPEPSSRMQKCLSAMSCETFAVENRVLAGLSDTQNTQGIIVIAERPSFALRDLWPTEGQPALLLAFDRVQDPGNFGTLVRTAEAAGAGGIIALEGCADAYSPKTLRSAMGSAFRLPVVSGVKSEALFAACAERGIQIVAAAGGASLTHVGYDWTRSSVLLLGNEARGVSDDLLIRCDAQIRIPMCAPVESLNVSAAGAVILFEAARQRAMPGRVLYSLPEEAFGSLSESRE